MLERLRAGLVVVAGNELVDVDRVLAATLPFVVSPDLYQQRAMVRHLAQQYIANAIATGSTAEDAVYGIISDLRVLAHDCGWSAP
jgi:hypothetical protein